MTLIQRFIWNRSKQALSPLPPTVSLQRLESGPTLHTPATIGEISLLLAKVSPCLELWNSGNPSHFCCSSSFTFPRTFLLQIDASVLHYWFPSLGVFPHQPTTPNPPHPALSRLVAALFSCSLMAKLLKWMVSPFHHLSSVHFDLIFVLPYTCEMASVTSMSPKSNGHFLPSSYLVS